jgi:hypothetical protein
MWESRRDGIGPRFTLSLTRSVLITLNLHRLIVAIGGNLIYYKLRWTGVYDLICYKLMWTGVSSHLIQKLVAINLTYVLYVFDP